MPHATETPGWKIAAAFLIIVCASLVPALSDADALVSRSFASHAGIPGILDTWSLLAAGTLLGFLGIHGNPVHGFAFGAIWSCLRNLSCLFLHMLPLPFDTAPAWIPAALALSSVLATGTVASALCRSVFAGDPIGLAGRSLPRP